VALLAFAGVHEERMDDSGVQILTSAGKSYARGMIAGTIDRWSPDVVITICDPFMLDPGEFPPGVPVMPWQPVDCDPLGELDGLWYRSMIESGRQVLPVAMSLHGQRMLREHLGLDAPVIPHAADPAVFYRDPFAGTAWRRKLGVPEGTFLISMCGVNNDASDRKGFIPQLLAFNQFTRKFPDTAMYIHTEAQNPEGLNLAKAAVSLGLQKRLVFADEYLRGADLYGDDYMFGMYNGSQLYSQASRGEGFGVNVIEALACGTPVIGTKAAAQTEIIGEDGRQGFLVGGQREWVKRHNAWWVSPSVQELTNAYRRAYLRGNNSKAWRAEFDYSYNPDDIAFEWDRQIGRVTSALYGARERRKVGGGQA
jgi:glycosyltransferase involved in cell wall biosynthesis